MQSPERQDRSTSRGRRFESTGRGGAGNIHSPVQTHPTDGPDDFSVTRGREPVPANMSGRAISSGRGGAGNIRTPSQTREGGTYDADIIRAIDDANDSGVYSTGRGGAGNIVRDDSRSQSRSRSRGPAVHAMGRGGAGNMRPGEPTEFKTILEIDDQERAAYQGLAHDTNMQSTGRGGVANIHPGPASPDDVVPAAGHVGHPSAMHDHEILSTGRGGAGNMRARSSSREPGQQGKVSALFHKLRGDNPAGGVAVEAK